MPRNEEAVVRLFPQSDVAHAVQPAISALGGVHKSVAHVLELTERALGANSVGLFWLDADGRWLRCKATCAHHQAVTEDPLPANEGLLGLALRREEPLMVRIRQADTHAINYYNRRMDVTDFMGIAVMEGDLARGVVFADRINDVPFSRNDIHLLQIATEEIARGVQLERSTLAVVRERDDLRDVHAVSRALHDAHDLDRVSQIIVEAAVRLSGAQVAWLALPLEDQDRAVQYKVTAVHGSADFASHATLAQTWQGRSFVFDRGLIGAAIKARHALPVIGSRYTHQPVFDEELLFHSGLRGVKVVPIFWNNNAVGALVLGHSSAEFLDPQRLELVRVMVDYAAGVIVNVRLFERLEKQAITDGLTGLINHRHFATMFDAALARGARYRRPMSLILADIDFFKRINDSYGHPVGDQVLVRVAQVMERTARRTDVVARYGGEEFAIFMEETHAQGAWHTAERLRLAIAEEVFLHEKQTFRCTLSLGVATFPEHGTNRQELTQRADMALYEAKHRGRNQTVVCDLSNLRVAVG